MMVGVPREIGPDERRVALVPGVVPALLKAGLEVAIESGAGSAAGYPDAAYAGAGARLVAGRGDLFRRAQVILQVRAYGADRGAGREDLERLREGQVVIGLLDPLSQLGAARELAATGAVAFALDLMPRIARAQGMDVLSSMATLTGYKAVILAAERLPRIFPLLMTAAGTLAPARVLVVGAGVAGLSAIATARRLGGVVQAYDLRPAVREQVLSLGARFVDLPIAASGAEDAGGYARAQDEAFHRRQREALARIVGASDVVIATAAVPGRRAPVLIDAPMVAVMEPGSVIVDLAADRGGNCELTRPGETTVEHGVAILGPLDLAATVPHHASQMYARNLCAFLLHLVKGGAIAIDLDDEITRETLLARGGTVVHARLRQDPGAVAAPGDGRTAPS